MKILLYCRECDRLLKETRETATEQKTLELRVPVCDVCRDLPRREGVGKCFG